MAKDKINGGGRNSFYDIPSTVYNVDSLARYLRLTGPTFNILKSLFGLNKARHTGTNTIRDSEKLIHYSIENYLWQDGVKETYPKDVIFKLINELKEEDKQEIITKLTVDETLPHLDLNNEVQTPIDCAKP